MSSDKRNSDLQRFLDQLQQAMPVTDNVDSPELAQLLDEYGRFCEDANSRLRECYDLIQRGQYADAVDLSEREPKLLQRLTMLEIPERDRLAAVAMCAGTRAPTLVDQRLFSPLQEAYLSQQKASSKVNLLHNLTLMRAPLPTRLAVMRKLLADQPNHPFLDSDIREFERAWFARAVGFANSCIETDRPDIITEIISDLEESGYYERPPSGLLPALKETLNKARAAQLAPLAEEIRREFQQLSASALGPLLDRWRQLVTTIDATPETTDKYGVSPAIAWFDQLSQDAARAEKCQGAKRLLQQILEQRSPQRHQLEGAYRSAKNLGAVDDSLERRYQLYWKRVSQRKRLVWGSILTTVALGVGITLTTFWVSARQASHESAVREVAAMVEPLLDSGAFDQAIQRIDEQPSSIATDPMIVKLRKRASDGSAVKSAEKVRNDELSRTEQLATANLRTFDGLLAAIKACDFSGDIKTLHDEAIKLAPNDSARKQVEATANNWRQAKAIKIADFANKAEQLMLSAKRWSDSAVQGATDDLSTADDLLVNVHSLRTSAKAIGLADGKLDEVNELLTKGNAAIDAWKRIAQKLADMNKQLNNEQANAKSVETIGQCLRECDTIMPRSLSNQRPPRATFSMTSVANWEKAIELQNVMKSNLRDAIQLKGQWKEGQPPLLAIAAAERFLSQYRQRNASDRSTATAKWLDYLNRTEFGEMWVLQNKGDDDVTEDPRWYSEKEPFRDKSTKVVVLVDSSNGNPGRAPGQFPDPDKMRVTPAPHSVYAKIIREKKWTNCDDGDWHNLLADSYDKLRQSDEMEPIIKFSLMRKLLLLASITSAGYRNELDSLSGYKAITADTPVGIPSALRSAVAELFSRKEDDIRWLNPKNEFKSVRKAAEKLLQDSPRLDQLNAIAAQADKSLGSQIKAGVVMIGWIRREADGRLGISRFAGVEGSVAGSVYTINSDAWIPLGTLASNGCQFNSHADQYVGWPLIVVGAITP